MGNDQTVTFSGATGGQFQLNIMMPVMDGKQALSAIRTLERRAGLQDGWGAKIVMTTALGDYDTVRHAFHNQCDGYLVKPLSISRMEALLRNLKVIGNHVSLRRKEDGESSMAGGPVSTTPIIGSAPVTGKNNDTVK